MLSSFFDNQKAKETLVNLTIGGRLPHALLIEGEPGCGKRHFARLIAGMLFCESSDVTQKPCGVCSACIKLEKGIHPDFTLIQGKGTSRSFTVDMVRKFRSEAYVSPNEASKHIFVLCNAQDMGREAQNALLKIIEEPPSTAMFIITCDSRAKLLPTVLSRVTLISLDLPGESACIKALRQRVPGKTDEDYARTAKVARFNIGKALGLLGDSANPAKEFDSMAEKLVEEFCFGSEFQSLCLLGTLEKDRAGLAETLLLTKELFCAAAIGREQSSVRIRNRVTPLQASRISDIIENAVICAQGNCNMPLVITHTCASIKAALSENK